MLKLLIIVVSVTCAVFMGTTASAQADGSTASAQRAPVLLVLVDTLPDAQPRFRILRMARASVQDVVLLPLDASPQLLTEALETLRMVWAAGISGGGDAPAGMFRAVPGRTQLGDRPVVPWGERVLNDLHQARERHVPGVGNARAVRIWLAPRPATAWGQP